MYKDTLLYWVTDILCSHIRVSYNVVTKTTITWLNTLITWSITWHIPLSITVKSNTYCLYTHTHTRTFTIELRLCSSHIHVLPMYYLPYLWTKVSSYNKMANVASSSLALVLILICAWANVSDILRETS